MDRSIPILRKYCSRKKNTATTEAGEVGEQMAAAMLKHFCSSLYPTYFQATSVDQQSPGATAARNPLSHASWSYTNYIRIFLLFFLSPCRFSTIPRTIWFGHCKCCMRKGKKVIGKLTCLGKS